MLGWHRRREREWLGFSEAESSRAEGELRVRALGTRALQLAPDGRDEIEVVITMQELGSVMPGGSVVARSHPHGRQVSSGLGCVGSLGPSAAQFEAVTRK